MLLSGCYTVDMPRTPQQKSLNHKALEILATPIIDPEDDDSEEPVAENSQKDPPVDPIFLTPISISVTENMNARQTITEMSNLAGLNVFIANDIEGNVSFVAKDRPFLDILKDICGSLNLKYTIQGNSVKIEKDVPITKVYNVQFLNMQREMQSSVAISTDLFMNQSISAADKTTTDTSSSVTNNGSKCEVSGIAKNDFWTELEVTLKSIIGENENCYISFHKQGGLVTVHAPESKQREVQEYLKTLKENSEEQVLIEAKILEIDLNDEYHNGINWDIFSKNNWIVMKNATSSVDNLITMGADHTTIKNIKDAAGTVTGTKETSKFNMVSGLLEKFGAVKTLSSPRLTVLNNQSAILKVARNEVIYLPEIQKQYSNVLNGQNADYVSTTLHTIPIGLIMSVQPSIDRKNNSILLTIRPTISEANSYADVPIYYNGSTSTSNNENSSKLVIATQKIPIVNIREMDSVLKLKSGQIVVMGGLMKEQSMNNRSGLPGTQETGLEFITGSNDKTTHVTELVIFLKATIMKKRAYHKADENAYKTFSNDTRPLRFEDEKNEKK